MGIPFKLYEGKEANLPAELTAGGIYFCEDSGNVFIDIDIDGTVTRVPLGKKYVDSQIEDIRDLINNSGSGIEIQADTPTKENANVWIDLDDDEFDNSDLQTNLLHNWYLLDPIDPAQGYVVPPNTTYYTDATLTEEVVVGTVEDYTAAIKADDVGKIELLNTTYYVKLDDVKRGYCDASTFHIPAWCNNYTSNVTLLEDNGVTWVNRRTASTQVHQKVGEVEPGTYTLSFIVTNMVSDKSCAIYIYDNTAGTTVSSQSFSSPGFYTLTFTLTQRAFLRLQFTIAVNNTLTLSAIKLEKNSISTLATVDNEVITLLDNAPNRTQEEYRCRGRVVDTLDEFTPINGLTNKNLTITKSTPTIVLSDDSIAMRTLIDNDRSYIQIRDSQDLQQSRRRQIIFSPAKKESSVSKCLSIQDVDVNNKGVTYQILHEGNRPTGSYVGSGTPGETLQLNAGNLIAIWSAAESDVGASLALVTPYGFFGVEWWGSGDFGEGAESTGTFSQGLLTKSIAFNTSGVTYYYQVLG